MNCVELLFFGVLADRARSKGDGPCQNFRLLETQVRSIKHTRERPTIYAGTSILEAGRQTERPRETVLAPLKPIREPSLNFFGTCHGVVSRPEPNLS